MTPKLKVNGVGRDLSDPDPMARRTLNVYLNREYTDDEMRELHDAFAEVVRLMAIEMPRLGDAELSRREVQPSDAPFPKPVGTLNWTRRGEDVLLPGYTEEQLREYGRQCAELSKPERREQQGQEEVTANVVLAACNAYDSTPGVGQYLSDYPAMHAAITAAVEKMQETP